MTGEVDKLIAPFFAWARNGTGETWLIHRTVALALADALEASEHAHAVDLSDLQERLAEQTGHTQAAEARADEAERRLALVMDVSEQSQQIQRRDEIIVAAEAREKQLASEIERLAEALDRCENDWSFIFNLAPGLPAEIEAVLHVVAEVNLRAIRESREHPAKRAYIAAVVAGLAAGGENPADSKERT